MKTALLATNFIGFFHFLLDDIDMLNQMGYKVYALANNEKQETHTLKILESKNVTFFDVRIDTKSPLTKTNIEYYRTVKQILRKHHFDLIHCHTPIVGLFVRLAAKRYRGGGRDKGHLYDTRVTLHAPFFAKRIYSLPCR